MRDKFIKRVLNIAKNDPSIMLLTGDLGFGVLDEFAKELPNQFVNVGVAEQNMIGIAAGLALEGHKVITYSIGNFGMIRCLEQIRNDLAYHDANVTVVTVGCGFSYGSLGMSHHATEDVSILRTFPIQIYSPGDLWEAESLADVVLSKPGTKYLRLDKAFASNTHHDGEIFLPGKARIIREGDDITLISTSGILQEVINAADLLANDGINARIVHFNTLKPIDREAVVTAAEYTGGIVTIEEHVLEGGLGSIVAEILLDRGVMPRCFGRLGVTGGFTSTVGSQSYLRKKYGIDSEGIIHSVKQLIRQPKSISN